MTDELKAEPQPVATDRQIELMKEFWRVSPDDQPMRMLNAALLKQDFLSLLATVEALRSERDALREASQWQPIDTAPKDGTEILAWFPCMKLNDDGDLTDEPVDEEPFGGRAITSWSGCWEEPDWLSASGEFFGDDFEYAAFPSLWMPLPAPPALASTGNRT